jgi:hypothetical protein
LEDFFLTFSGCTVWGPNSRISQEIFGDSLPDSRATYFAKVLDHAQWFGGCSPSAPKPEVALKILGSVVEGDTTHVVFRATPNGEKRAAFVGLCTTVRTKTGYALIPSVTAQDVLMQLGVAPKEN